MRPFALPFALFTVFVFDVGAVAQSALQAKVASIAADAKGTVAVSCLLPGTALNSTLR